LGTPAVPPSPVSVITPAAPTPDAREHPDDQGPAPAPRAQPGGVIKRIPLKPRS
jgi:hypothetical protein